MTKNRTQFIKGVISGYSYTIVSLGVSIWMIPFVLGYLTKTEYAVFAILGELLGWLTMANLGITASFNSKSAHLLGVNDYKELNIISSTTFYTQLLSTIIIIFLGVLLCVNPQIILGETSTESSLKLVIAITLISFIISYITQPLNALLIADKQIHIDNYLKFFLLVLRTILTIAMLMAGYKLVALALSNLIGTLITSVITWYRVKKTLPNVLIKRKYFRTDRLKYLLKYGIWFSIGGIAGLLILRMDTFLIGKYISLALATNFIITYKLYQIADSFHQQLFNTTRPYFAQTFGKKDMQKLTRLFRLVFYSSFGIAFTAGTAIYLLNSWFISIWIGPGYYLGDEINLLMCINFILQASVLPNRIILATSLFKIELHNITRILEGILKLTLGIILIPTYGISAVLIGSIIGSLILSNTALNWITCDLLKTPFTEKIKILFPIFFIPFIHLYLTGIAQYLGFAMLSSIILAMANHKTEGVVQFLSMIGIRKNQHTITQ